MNNSLLQIIAMFLFPFLGVLIPIILGQWYGLYIKTKSNKVNDSPVSAVVGASLGFLAFMLALTFQIVDNRYNSRKELLLDEVTTIRTTYLRSGLIPEPYRSASRNKLLKYIELRADLVDDVTPKKIQNLIVESKSILDSLWNYSEALAKEDRSSEAYSLYMTSVNELIDIYNKRITFTFEYRVPTEIFGVLFLIIIFSMLLLGYQFGLSGKTNYLISVFISIIFGAVMWLILALDRPETGLIRLNQKPIISLYKELN